MKQRNAVLDIAKGLSIFCVMIVHFEFVGLYSLGSAFSVPMFFILSGYLTKPQQDFGGYVKKRAARLMIPYAVTCAVIAVVATAFHILLRNEENPVRVFFRWIFAGVYGAGDTYTEPFFIPQIGGIWFMWAMLWGMIGLQLLLRLPKQIRWLVAVILFVAGTWTAEHCFWLPFSFQAGLCAIGFMYIGYVGKTLVPVYQKQSRLVKGLFLAVCVIGFGLFCYFFEGYWLVHCEYQHGILDILGSLCACVCALAASALIDRYGHLSKLILSWMGVNSLVILCVHIFELVAFPWDRFAGWVVSLGVSEYLASALVVRLCKVIWITIASILCVRWNVTRRIFGLPVLPKKQ